MSEKKEIAIIGGNGQLGKELAAFLPAESVSVLSRQDADLETPGAITSLLKRLEPRLVFNCAAYNQVDLAEADPNKAFAINAFAAREVSHTAAELGITVVHFSTDYVFGSEGFRNLPYKEGDCPGPLSTYGISKLAGENFVRAFCPRHFIIRTCGLYGKHGSGGKGTNFVKTMLKLAAAGKSIKVVEDQILAPSFAQDVAKATLRLIEDCPFGLYHLTNSGQTSWYGFASKIFELTGVAADLTATTSAEYGSKANRPPYSVLTTEHACAPRLRSWEAALEEYLKTEVEA